MIDTTYLNGYQKEFAREVGQLRFLLTLINELKMNFQQIKNISESESKSFDSLQKNISNQVKIFLTDSSTVNDDPTLFLKFSNMFISILDNYGRCFSDEVSIINSTVYKMNHQISEEYSILTKGIVENSNFVLKDLLNSRAKYRSSVNKTEKVVKELETAFSSKRKLDNEHSYNMTLRDKVEDRILNLLNDFEEYKGIINNNFDEVKKFENFLNEFLKNQFSKILKFSFVNHKRLHSNYETIVGIKIALFNKIKIILDSGVESIKYIEIDYSSNEYEKKYCDLKSVKFGKLYLKFR